MFYFDDKIVLITGAAVEKFGRVDIAVNNAGIAASFKSFTDITEADFDNIRCNAICPFFSPTSLMTNNNMDHQQDFLGAASPMKRLPSTEEVVDVMISIIAPKNSYMNGLAIAVDGGISAY